MKTDDFEKRLRHQAPREIPAAWRAEILGAARTASDSNPAPRAARPGLLCLVQQFTVVFRLHRAIWAGLAAIWLVILGMNFSATEKTTATTRNNLPPARETLQALKQQRRLFAELVDRPAPRDAAPFRTIPPGPRSQRREEFIVV